MTPPPESVRRRLQAETTQLWAAPGVIDLGVGQPQDAILPLEIMSRALARAATSGRRHPLQYGIERGDGYLRLALADFLETQDGLAVDPDLMLVSNGNSQAIDLCCAEFAAPGDVVFVEEPTYFLALRIFRDHGVQVVGIPVDEQGLRVDALEAALALHRPAFLYTIPAAHNPTGATLPSDRRRRIVDLAREHGFLIVADEVYHLLRYDGPGPQPFAAQLDSGVVLSLGTFSKILAPGLRLGWIQAAAPLLRRLERRGVLASGGGLNPFTAAIVTDLLEDGSATAYLHQLRALLRARVEVMDDALRQHFPPEVSYTRPSGGYFFWLRMPDGVDTAAVRPEALRRGAGFQPGSAFSTVGGLTSHLRLSFAYYDTDDLRTAVAILGQSFTAACDVLPATPAGS